MKEIQDRIMDNTLIGDVDANRDNIQKWWKQYLAVNNSQLTSLFYGNSISSSQCSKCSKTFLNLSSMNSMYITLPLKQKCITVNLIVEHLDVENERMTLQTRYIHLKVNKGATFLDVKNSLDELLKGSSLCSFLVLGTYNTMTRSLTVLHRFHSSHCSTDL